MFCRYLNLLILNSILVPSFLFAEKDKAEDSWEAVTADLTETEALLQGWQAEAEILSDQTTLDDPFGEELPNWFWGVTLSPTVGFTSNVLQGNEALSSTFIHPEMDIFLSGFPTDNTSVTAFAFGSWTRYDRAIEFQEESLVFGQIDSQYVSRTWLAGLQVDLFYGDQIYDSSLGLTGDRPEGSLLRQFNHTWRPYVEKVLGQKHRLRLSSSYREGLFGDSRDDFREGSAEATLKSTWSPSLQSTLVMSGSYQDYAERNIRRSTGQEVSGQLLDIRIYRLENKVVWQTPIPNLESTTRIRAETRDDNGFGYEDQIRFLFVQELDLEWNALEFKAGGRYLLVDYDNRLVSSSSRTINQQNKKTAYFEALWNWSDQRKIFAEISWERFHSKVESERFERVQLIGGLSFSF